MITLITGIPGMGKTSLLITMLLKEAEKGERPLFVMGIPDLKIEHNPAPPIAEWTHQRQDPDDPSLMLDYYSFPPNSILIIDEAQRVFRSRSSGSKVPAIVAALETHRHTGLDIWLLTQKPLLIDLNVRELVQRHYHIKPTIFGRSLYEFPEFTDVKNKQELKDGSKRRFSPPKEAFKYYTSTVQVTKNPVFVHRIFFFLSFSVCITGYMGYKVYNGLYKRVTQHDSGSSLINSASAAELPKSEKPKTDSPAPTSAKTVIEDIPHPYKGFDFYIKAVITSKTMNRTYFEVVKGSKIVQTNSDELIKLGYSIMQPNDCSAFLFFNGANVVATCNSSRANGVARPREDGSTSFDSTEQAPSPDLKPLPLIDGSDFAASARGA